MFGATIAAGWIVALASVVLGLVAMCAWMLLSTIKSHRAAMQEAVRQVEVLKEEIRAHDMIDAGLRRAREAAEAANAAKSRYLVSVSHEIRSPLNSIYGYAQLMERGHDVAPREAAKVIRRSAEHLTNLVEGLLDISQVECGVLRIASEPVKFAPFLDQTADMFRLQAQAKGLEFRYERPDNPPELVRTDQKRLRQILINLLSNAIKFTHTGSVTLRVSYRSDLATFEIVDSGIGIDPGDLEQVFVPFERGSNPLAQRQKGVGLGLSITQALVQILGGDLAVRSEPGHGTTFTVRLRMGRAADSVDPAPSLECITGYRGKRLTALLIDDDPNQLAILRGLLEPLDVTVHEALNGVEAMALAQAQRPDIVLLDIALPGESGWDICRALRESLGGAVRIVMLSANAHEFRPVCDGDAMHDMFLIKPVQLDALLNAIADLLDIRWTGEEDCSAAGSAAEHGQEGPLPAAAGPLLAQIEQSAVIGHVRGIERGIRDLEQSVPQAGLLAARLLMQLDRFDLKGLIAAVRAAR